MVKTMDAGDADEAGLLREFLGAEAVDTPSRPGE
jgi:hypothetical protein